MFVTTRPLPFARVHSACGRTPFTRGRFGRAGLALMTLASCATFSGDVAAQAPARGAQTPSRVGPTFSFAGKRPEIAGNGWTSAIVISAENSEGRLSVLDETWKPGFQLTPRLHKSHAETFYIVSGRVEWTVGGQTQTLGTDDAVHVPAHTAFTAKVMGGEDVKIVHVYQPGGFEVTQAFVQTLTPAQLADPAFAKLLEAASDVYVATPAMLAARAGIPVKYFDARATREKHEDDGPSDVAVSSIDSGGRFNLQEEHWKENFFAGLHFHKTKSETFYILGGRAEWTVGGETHIMTAGDAVHIPPNTPHTVKGLDGKQVHTLLMYEPFGYDTRLRFRDSLTPEQRRDPALQRLLQTIQDFNSIGR